MKTWAYLGILALACGGTRDVRASAEIVHVEAKLLAVDRAPACGVNAFVSPGTYLILRGPPEMVGQTVELLIPCIEARGAGYPRIGDVSNLDISERPPGSYDWMVWRSRGHGGSPSREGKKWYVMTGSLGPDVPVAYGSRKVQSARSQIGVTTIYDPAYVRIGYPMGDVPSERGVCADVVVRAFRGNGIDLQRLVHEDMAAHFGAYPHTWGLRGPDTNIDHRRVPNLETFFRRKGAALPVTALASDYHPGDVVSWRLSNGLAHIGLVSDRLAPDGSGRPLVIHNIGAGAQEEDVLFAFTVVGHFRWNTAAVAARR